jgi:hypothetical protein
MPPGFSASRNDPGRVKTNLLQTIERFKDKTPMEPDDLRALYEAAVESLQLRKQLDDTKTNQEYEELRRAFSGLLAETIVTKRDENHELRCVACNCLVSAGERHSSVCPVELARKALSKK